MWREKHRAGRANGSQPMIHRISLLILLRDDFRCYELRIPRVRFVPNVRFGAANAGTPIAGSGSGGGRPRGGRLETPTAITAKKILPLAQTQQPLDGLRQLYGVVA